MAIKWLYNIHSSVAPISPIFPKIEDVFTVNKYSNRKYITGIKSNKLSTDNPNLNNHYHINDIIIKLNKQQSQNAAKTSNLTEYITIDVIKQCRS